MGGVGATIAHPKGPGGFIFVAGLFFGVVFLWASLKVRSRVYEVRAPADGPITFLSIDKKRELKPAEVARLVRYEHYQDGHLDHFVVGWPQGAITLAGPAAQLDEVFARIRALTPQAAVSAQKYDPNPDPD
jgi:hypothetical protein